MSLPPVGRDELLKAIWEKKSFLSVGLDTDLLCLPTDFEPRARPWARICAFNLLILRSTRALSVAYKLNTAFYEALGSEGYKALEGTLSMIRREAPEALVIVDAKRGDIGHTAQRYAQSIFGHLGADAVTLSPFMGRDSVEPFLDYKKKWVILLAATSNPGFFTFQGAELKNGQKLWEKVLEECSEWGTSDQLMFVIGATRGSQLLQRARSIIADYFFLLPGVGAQGGDLAESYLAVQGSVLVNASRSITQSAQRSDLIASSAHQAAHQIQSQMSALLMGTTTARIPTQDL